MASQRRVRYGVAMSLDGYIAGPTVSRLDRRWTRRSTSPASFGRFDTLLIGRKTFEAMAKMGAWRGHVARYHAHRVVPDHEAGRLPQVTIVADAGRVVTD